MTNATLEALKKQRETYTNMLHEQYNDLDAALKRAKNEPNQDWSPALLYHAETINQLSKSLVEIAKLISFLE